MGQGYTYADAGVSIDAGNALVRRIAPLARATARPGADGALGGFGGLFDPRAAGFADPVLVAATDGVGTKVKLAIETGRHEGIGIDLVAMCVNDLLASGAEPLFFLDYFATGKLDLGVAQAVVASIADGCAQAGCALIGGETAEMPGMYDPGDYDLAGFSVGAFERGRGLTGETVAPGDILIGLSSSGVHANGFSLVRRLAADKGWRLDAPVPFAGEGTLGQALLAPTRIYVRAVLPEIRAGRVKALAHITGGGLLENLPRVLPDGARAMVDAGAWILPPLFGWLQSEGAIATEEMARTFNCGIGLVLVIAPEEAEAVMAAVAEAGEQAFAVGRVEPGARGCQVHGLAGSWGSAEAWRALHDA